MSDIRVGDQISLSKYAGFVGLGTPEAHSVYEVQHQGVVRSTGHSDRFGPSVHLDCSIEHEDLDEDETHYLLDYEVDHLNVVTCPKCDGRGHIQVQPAPRETAIASASQGGTDD